VEADIRYAQSRGLSVAYAESGEGELDLVVVPGFVSHLEVGLEQPLLAQMFRRLASFARVITFDKPGTGLSDPVSGAPTLEERMEDLRAVMDAAGAERAALLGASEGAPMSALFAATHPGRVRALIMYGSYARGTASADYPWAPSPDQIAAAVEAIGELWGTGAMLEAFAPSVAGEPDYVRWWARFQRMAASPAMAKAVVELAAEIDVTDVLPGIRVPTLVLHRTDDMLWPVEGARFVAERIPGARLVEVPGIDHQPWVGDVEPLMAEIESFLTGARHAPEPDRQLLTVLFTDIVGSTGRAAELGDHRWRELLETHDQCVRGKLDAHRGLEVKTTGDGFIATFDGPARAVHCALEICEAVGPIGVQVRAGVHTGECEVTGDDVVGIAVNIGARVGDLAGPGEVLVTGTVKDLVVGSSLDFEPRGTHELTGVPGEWNLFAAR
jgi:pimeloyl-ACP methyl ester carboxylesterase